MKLFVLLLALLSVAYSFDSTFNYGCNAEKCVYRFVVPEVISAYVDPAIFSSDFNNLTASLNALSTVIGANEDPSQTASDVFLSEFNDQYQAASPSINATVDTVAAIDQTNYTTLKTDSDSLLKLSNDLAAKGDCFVAGVQTSAYCGSVTKDTPTPAPSSSPSGSPTDSSDTPTDSSDTPTAPSDAPPNSSNAPPVTPAPSVKT